MLRFSPPGEYESKSRCKESCLEQRFLAFIGIVKSLKHNQTNSMGDFLCSPFSLSRCRVLRQGFDKFYSVSFQARLSFFASLLTAGSPESLPCHEFLFPPLTEPLPSTEFWGERTSKNINFAVFTKKILILLHSQVFLHILLPNFQSL